MILIIIYLIITIPIMLIYSLDRTNNDYITKRLAILAGLLLLWPLLVLIEIADNYLKQNKFFNQHGKRK
jgi:hypothetical protein